MHRQAQARQIDFEVWFMAENEEGRHWPYDSAQCKFPHRVLPGIHPRIFGQEQHINPQAWWRMLRQPPTWLVLGGAWQFPTIMGLALLGSLRRSRTNVVFHLEANYHFTGHTNGIFASLRRWIVHRADALAVPGEIARTTISDHWRVSDSQYIPLPNVVDDSIYLDQVNSVRESRDELRKAMGFATSDRVILFPARLVDTLKGNLNFLAQFVRLKQGYIHVLLAGDGPDRQQIEEQFGSDSRVHLLGFQGSDRMIELFAMADLLALPSFKDPNPLSIIEGLWAALPILGSYGCGNWPEAVEPGMNGWLVDPHNSDEMFGALDEFVTAPAEKLVRFGRRSLEIAHERFDTEKVVANFYDGLFDLSAPY